ncbi:MAG TPA: hypothetical protein VLF88_03245, partial [Candidatus Babeliales bacterium]|nr:hypothetical protein [Candidatus Babeliales bacterium]
SGTLGDGRLSSNVALLNRSGQSFTGDNTFAPTSNGAGTTIKQTSGTATSGSVLDIQTANGSSHFLQITNAAANEGNVTLQSVGATRDLTLGSGSGTIIIAAAANTIQHNNSGLTIDINNGTDSTFTITNSQGGAVANLSVEGDIAVAASHVYKVGATSGVNSTCASNTFSQNQTINGGIVSANTCANAVTSISSSGGSIANGASISGNALTLGYADTSNPGLVSNTTQSFNGTKTFTTGLTAAATSATAFQVQTSGGSSTLFTVDTTNSKVTIGNAAGSGLFTNNGGTINSTLALGDFNYTGSGNTGSIGSAATTVDIYTSISIAQTTTGQTLTIPTPTASTSYGRLLYLANVGTTSFLLSGIRIPQGNTATLVWSNSNGGASWHFAGAGATSIENQNSSDQTADFRISGTGRANTSFVSPLFDSITGALGLGTGTATGVNIGGTTNTTSIVLQGAAGSTYVMGTSNNTGGITIGNSTVANTIAIGASSGNGTTQTINIGTSSTSGSTTRVNIGSSAGGYTQVNGSLGVGTSTTPNEALQVNGAINLGTTTNTNAGTIRWNGTDFQGYDGSQWKSMTTQFLSVTPQNNVRKSADQCINNSGSGGCGATGATFVNDTELAYSIGASETWNFRFVVNALAGNTGGIKFTVVAANATTACSWGVADVEQGSGQGNIACGSTVTTAIKGTNAAEIYEIMGTVVNTATTNTITLQWAQNAAGTQTATVYAGSFLQANRILAAGAATLQAFVNNGNTFSADTYLGTNDGFALNLQTNGQSLANFSGSNGAATFKNWGNSTAAFQIQNTGGNTLFSVDTTNNLAVVGKAGSYTGTLALANSSNSNTVNLSSGATSSTYSILLPTSAGSASQCLQYGGAGGTQLQWGACGTNSSGIAKNAADSSSASVSAGSQLYAFTNSASAGTGSVLKLDNGTNTNSALIVSASGNPTSGQAIIFASNTNASATGNLIDLQSGASPTSKFSVTAAGAVTATSYGNITGTGALTISSGGATALNLDTGGGAAINIGATNATSFVLGGNTSATITEKTANSSTTAFRLQTAGGTNYLVMDTTNSKLSIGAGSTGEATGIVLILDSDTDATYRGGTASNAPTAVNGAMFYSSSDHAFICGVDSSWQTCSGILGSNTAASTAVNTCTTACPSFDNGRFVIPANYLQPGKVIHLVAQGVYSTTGTPTFGAWGVYFGSNATTQTSDTLLGGASATSAALPSNAASQLWTVDFTITCYTAGAGGTVSAKGTFTFVQSATTTTSETVLPMSSSTTTSMNTTASQTIYLFPGWGTSNGSNTATAQQFYLKTE